MTIRRAVRTLQAVRTTYANDGSHAKPNEDATYARTQPFRGGISGSVLEGGNADDNAGNADGAHDMAEDVL